MVLEYVRLEVRISIVGDEDSRLDFLVSVSADFDWQVVGMT